MSNYGIKISLPGKSINDSSTSSVNNLNNPQLKLDTQNPTSFQNILLLIVDDPPEPSGGNTDAYTTVYSFAHGYSYIPSVETLFYVKSPSPGTNFYQTYFQDMGIVATQNSGSYVTLYASADAQNVYFIIDKTDDFGGSPNLLTGLTLQISCHVFLDDIGV